LVQLFYFFFFFFFFLKKILCIFSVAFRTASTLPLPPPLVVHVAPAHQLGHFGRATPLSLVLGLQ
jgi:hypothetical protein